MGQHANKRDDERTWSRFDAKVALVPFSDCHYWTGTLANFGYGEFKIDGRAERAHRIAYERCNGSIPEGLVVRHRCDQPLCVNPDHLELGTQAENMADAAQRERMPKGATHWKAKLTDSQVAEIKCAALAGEQTGALAMRFGVSKATISTIRHGNTAHCSRADGVHKPTGRTDRRVADAIALEIYRRANSGEPRASIADDYGVKPSFVADIKRGATYASVTGHRR